MRRVIHRLSDASLSLHVKKRNLVDLSVGDDLHELLILLKLVLGLDRIFTIRKIESDTHQSFIPAQNLSTQIGRSSPRIDFRHDNLMFEFLLHDEYKRKITGAPQVLQHEGIFNRIQQIILVRTEQGIKVYLFNNILSI